MTATAPANEHPQTTLAIESNVNNTGATFANQGHVYNAPITHQTVVHDNAVTYPVEHEDVEGLEKISRTIVSTLGENGTKIAAAFSLTAGGGSFYIAINQTPAVLAQLPGLMYIAIIGILIGAIALASLRYRSGSKCPRCQTFFGLREHGTPTAREVRSAEGIQRTTTRFYKCQACGHETVRSVPETLPANEAA